MARSKPRAPVSAPPPTPIQSCLDRLAYDPTAKEELIVACRKRVRVIVHSILAKYPRLNATAHFDDVEQDALIRLSDALKTVAVARTRHFLRLAARHVRQAVVDILRREFPRWADGRVVLRLDTPLPAGQALPAAKGSGFTRCELYDLFDQLDEWERGAIDCLHLLGMSQEEMAAAYGVDERTVRRWYASAKLRLGGLLGLVPAEEAE